MGTTILTNVQQGKGSAKWAQPEALKIRNVVEQYHVSDVYVPFALGSNPQELILLTPPDVVLLTWIAQNPNMKTGKGWFVRFMKLTGII